MNKQVKKKLWGVFLSVSFLLSLTACSTKQIVEQETLVKVPPDEMLVPCRIDTRKGPLVEHLVEAYIENINNLVKCSLQIELHNKWLQEQEIVYRQK